MTLTAFKQAHDTKEANTEKCDNENLDRCQRAQKVTESVVSINFIVPSPDGKGCMYTDQIGKRGRHVKSISTVTDGSSTLRALCE